MFPINSADPMRHNISSIGLIRLNNVAILFRKLPKIAHNNANVASYEPNFVIPQPLLKRQSLKSKRIVRSTIQQRPNRLNNLRVQRAVVLHANLVLPRKDVHDRFIHLHCFPELSNSEPCYRR